MLADLDAAAFRWLLAHRSPVLDRAMLVFSYFGAYAWLVLAIVMGFARPRRWPGVFQVVLAIGLSTLLTDTIAKPLVGRSRPYALHANVDVIGVRETNASFPSTHASNASAGAHAMSRAFPEARVLFWSIAVLVAVSRVYVGVHYPLDVVVGGLVGFLAAAFAIGGTTWRPGPKPRARG